MTPMISAAPTSTTASTEKLVMAASFHTSGVSSTDLPVDCTKKKTGTLNHCVTAESSLIYIFRVRFTLLHVLHEGVLGYCLHDAHGTQTSKSEFQNSELPHWPAHGNKTSQITIISYGSFTSSVRKQWVKAGYFFNLFNIIIIEVIFRDRCNCCRNQPNFLN